VLDDEQPWMPEPIPAESFDDVDEWVNINRSPHDRVAGAVYKRAANIKGVYYKPAEPAPEMPESWRGQGGAVVRWLFSEETGSEEGLLPARAFRYLREVNLDPGASTGQRAHPGLDTLVYVIEGCGELSHRPTAGSPVLVRPLRLGDAVLIEAAELYSISNATDTSTLRLVVLGLGCDSREEAHER
jgi:quercetin dioxygenase-like cupin family protein